MSANRVREYLVAHGIRYELTEHALAYTAQEVAASEHVSGHAFAKPVLLSVGEEMVMVVLPGSLRLDMAKVQAVFGRQARLAQEPEFAPLFPDCERGAEPPFGNLYGVSVYMDERLRDADDIVCNAGSHTETIKLALEDFMKSVRPVEVNVASA